MSEPEGHAECFAAIEASRRNDFERRFAAMYQQIAKHSKTGFQELEKVNWVDFFEEES